MRQIAFVVRDIDKAMDGWTQTLKSNRYNDVV